MCEPKPTTEYSDTNWKLTHLSEGGLKTVVITKLFAGHAVIGSEHMVDYDWEDSAEVNRILVKWLSKSTRTTTQRIESLTYFLDNLKWRRISHGDQEALHYTFLPNKVG